MSLCDMLSLKAVQLCFACLCRAPSVAAHRWWLCKQGSNMCLLTPSAILRQKHGVPQDMGVDAVLQSTMPVDKGGVLTVSSRGQLWYDLGALTRELHQRWGVDQHPAKRFFCCCPLDVVRSGCSEQRAASEVGGRPASHQTHCCFFDVVH